MYRTCLFCSGALGGNEALEEFPVGRTVAFDAWRGRLWAVCPGCARWNLAPIEERWEAVESADRLFTDARLRVQSENVGLAKLRDGTRLIRIGQALPGELAAWRYGSQLAGRRRQYLIATAAAVAGGALFVGATALLSLGGVGGLMSIAAVVHQQRELRRVIHHVPAEESPTGEALSLRYWHAVRARLELAGDESGIQIHVADLSRKSPPPRHGGARWHPNPPGVVLPDAIARRVLEKTMVSVNHEGASRRKLETALGFLAAAGSAEAFVRQTAREHLTVGSSFSLRHRKMGSEQALALEMALHEETERRAMEGELAVLQAAWREAEEIAAIADALPGDLPARITPPPTDTKG